MGIVWSGELISGNPIIDFQHKLALEMVKKLLDDYKSGGSKFTLEEAVTFFECYTIEHFGDEEDIISRNKLPGLDEHVRQHKEMARNLMIFKDKVSRSGFSRTATAELLTGLSEYLATHFKKADRKAILSLKKIYSPSNKLEFNTNRT